MSLGVTRTPHSVPSRELSSTMLSERNGQLVDLFGTR